LMPSQVLAHARLQADALLAKPRSLWAAACFVVIWLVLGFYFVRWLW